MDLPTHKQRHTAKRIFERLRDEHGYAGGITIVKDYVRVRRLRHREVFVPLHGMIPATRRWILARRWRRSPGWKARSTSLDNPQHATPTLPRDE